MTKRKVPLNNRFHGTETYVMARLINDTDVSINFRQAQNAKKRLCGISGCLCSTPIGTEGPQPFEVEPYYNPYLPKTSIYILRGLWKLLG